MGQLVAHLHDRYMMMMMMIKCENCVANYVVT